MKPTKKLNELFTDDRAISPVVGVALLIAITVILASVIGGVVLGIGVGPTEAPNAQLDAEFADDGTVTIEHNGGDPLNNGQTVAKEPDGSTTDLDLTAGQSQDISPTDNSTITVVWQDPESDSATELAQFEA